MDKNNDDNILDEVKSLIIKLCCNKTTDEVDDNDRIYMDKGDDNYGTW